MNKSLILFALIACASIANAATCAGDNTIADGSNCYCAQGYIGEVNTGAGTNTCVICETNSTTNTPGATNTGSSVTKQACDRCPAGTYMKTAAAATPAAAVCMTCPAKSQQLTVQTVEGFCTCKDGNALALDGTQTTCVCKANYYGVAADSATSGCTACPPKSTTAGADKAAITDCTCKDPKAATLSAQQTTCECKAGWTGTAADSATTGCTNCLAGTFKAAAGSAACANCPIGKISAAVEATACTDCAAGQSAVAGSSACTNCAAGKTSLLGSDLGCTDCPIGKFALNAGSASCSDCAAGKSSVAGATACTDCAAGKTSLLGSALGCTNCAAGTFAATAGSTSCTSCTGTKFSAAGATACTDCGAGSKVKQDFSGCDCFDTSAGIQAWTATANACACKANFYGDPSTKTTASTDGCTACPTDTVSNAGSKVATDCAAASSNSYLLAVSSVLISLVMLL